MSTAAAWDTLPARTAPVRPTFVVIDGAAGQVSARPSVLWVPRWVRLAFTLSVVAVVVSVAFGLGGASAAPGPLGSVEVLPGQTLTQIAQAEMPGLPAAEAVARIQLANNLPSTHVTAGQVIVIPAS
ncbi:LysM peptidoglycan-binding domain-containing protein [Nostocoides sp. F2B08]|uniref:LysM peptidoglycan-binding domain-containing protein n=1 Tax=Nostocoides sp. F2B08 TaxID=2653936 RepID=UPI001263AE19|nr:LysM peptidoglycan-binding domain-containing protein [Tetrasphaera sp. F2B08]KAB7739805.1 LysM peptidoglycan-binding domain-containing protein [Tetrasphaera sp. F2B08]